MKVTPGVDSTNFFCKAKSCWRTALGKKIDVQFQQQLKLQISSLNWHIFKQIILIFAKQTLYAKKMLLILCTQKTTFVCCVKAVQKPVGKINPSFQFYQNFTFLYQSVLHSFFHLQYSFAIFWAKEYQCKSFF